MFYAWDILIPADTKEAAPVRQILELPVGIITQVHIKFPAGCHGMVKVRLFRWGFQLVPLSSDEWITGDDESIPTETYYPLLATPTFLKFIGCSPDTTYPHTISVRIEVTPELDAAAQAILSRFDKLVEVLNPNG
jgi:hypothetical protein